MTTTLHESTSTAPPSPGLSGDFWKYWCGQTISNLGSGITLFLLPLLVFRLTGSAVNLALTSAAEFLPYPLFGLILGAWADRLDRRRLMIGCDLLRALLIASLPLLATLGRLGLWWIYLVGFLSSTLAIAFTAAEFAAVPSLVSQNDLVAANGRIQASYAAVSVLGPLLASPLLAIFAPTTLLWLDAGSFVISAGLVWLIRTSFNRETAPRTASVRQDIVDGLRYVVRHPVLRAISAMMALINFVGATQGAQLVLFAKERFRATDSQVSLLYSAGSVGVILLSLLAGPLRQRWPFSRVALGALLAGGVAGIGLALAPQYWAALLLWALMNGLGSLFNINTGSLRQAITPNDFLGRVSTVARVLTWSVVPLGTLLGGLAIEWTGNVALIYLVTATAQVLIALAFSFTALGHAERYLPPVPAGTVVVSPAGQE